MARIPPKELLEATHRFPGIYVFKLIGTPAGPFEAHVRRVAGPEASLSQRLSEGGRHLALTIEIHVTNADQVIEIYQKLIIAPDLALIF